MVGVTDSIDLYPVVSWCLSVEKSQTGTGAAPLQLSNVGNSDRDRFKVGLHVQFKGILGYIRTCLEFQGMGMGKVAVGGK